MADRPARIFGVTTTLSGIADGIIANNFSKNQTVDVAEARDEHGVLLDLAPYSKNTEISIDGLFVGEGVDVGSAVEIGGLSGLVSNVTKTESNTAFQTASITVRQGDDITVIHTLDEIQNQ